MPIKSVSLSAVLGTLLPTLLGLGLLLTVPVWSMKVKESLHQRIENDVVPARESVQQTIVKAQWVRADVNEYVVSLDPIFSENYRKHKNVWQQTVQNARVASLHDSGVLSSWQTGVAKIEEWQSKYGDINLQEAQSLSRPAGYRLFQQGIGQLEATDQALNRMEDGLRAEVRQLERDEVAMSMGLGLLCGLLVLFSWRNAVALHRALYQVARNAERLEVAVQETNHRVKNNLQTIGALIDMNRQDYDEQIPRRILDDIYQQVRTVAAVHDFLSHEHQANRVAVRPMLDKLVKLTASAKELSATVEAEAIDLPVKEATSAALIANELVLNAGKHGAKCIHVHFTVCEGQCALRVCDDGPGLPPDFSVAKHGNLGTTLIETLAHHDLGGTVQWANGLELGGAEIVINFPLPATDG
jgi:two-component sensor histidine kinase